MRLLVYSAVMSAATLVYPHQLFADSPALSTDRVIYVVEEPLLLTHNPIHRQKLIFHKLSLDAYERSLQAQGYTTKRLTIEKHPTTEDVFAALKEAGVSTVHIVDTTDEYLERAIKQSGLKRVWYESPLFILAKADAMKRYTESKKHMARFYKSLRQEKQILVGADGEPTGGQWSFDEDNRKKLPKDIQLPDDLELFGNQETVAAAEWAEGIEAEQYGEAGCWVPYTAAGAEKFLEEFFRTRFQNFGPYEDALTTAHTRLFHSTLSPLLNVGLLTPQQVIDTTLTYATKHNVPINSLEGFVRQILGWREFIRASYECDGNQMRRKNFFSHTNTLPNSFWEGSTDIPPIDHVINTALQFGYTHHIERLMVMGNFMLLCQTNPDDVYRWFMGMYLDAYDWVMVPNVYGMSQFADGGSFATKPYISGANYLKKMSDYKNGDWEATWTALYWNFIAKHRAVFESNHRMAMMPRLLDRMNQTTKDDHLKTATHWLKRNFVADSE